MGLRNSSDQKGCLQPALQSLENPSRFSAFWLIKKGIQRSGRTRKGNRALRTGLVQMAHAAAHTKDTYLSALYHRLAARRGKKRAIVAVAHSIVRSAFHMLSRSEPYHELGGNYFDEHRREHLVDRLTRRIERLGYRVALEPAVTS